MGYSPASDESRYVYAALGDAFKLMIDYPDNTKQVCLSSLKILLLREDSILLDHLKKA